MHHSIEVADRIGETPIIKIITTGPSLIASIEVDGHIGKAPKMRPRSPQRVLNGAHMPCTTGVRKGG